MVEETLQTRGVIANTFRKLVTLLDFKHKKTLLGQTGSFILFLLLLLASMFIVAYLMAVILILTGNPFISP